MNVFNDLNLRQCDKEEEDAVFKTITDNVLSSPKCDRCLPPCNKKTYEFKVHNFNFKKITSLYYRQLIQGWIQTVLF